MFNNEKIKSLESEIKKLKADKDALNTRLDSIEFLVKYGEYKFDIFESVNLKSNYSRGVLQNTTHSFGTAITYLNEGKEDTIFVEDFVAVKYSTFMENGERYIILKDENDSSRQMLIDFENNKYFNTVCLDVDCSKYKDVNYIGTRNENFMEEINNG